MFVTMKRSKQVHLNPSEFVVHSFGGVRETARVLGRSPGSVCKWKTFRNSHGEVGGIPRNLFPLILKKSKDKGLDITLEDLVFGRAVKIS